MKQYCRWLILLISLGVAALTANQVRADPPSGPPADEKELKPLLERLSVLSGLIGQTTQTPDSWRHHLEQADIMIRVTAHSSAEERPSWLKMAIDSYYSAAVLSPVFEMTAMQRLAALPAEISRTYPENRLASYAALQEVQADYQREIAREGADPAKAMARHCQRMVRFAQEFPTSVEAPKAIMDAAQQSQSDGQIDEARSYYRYLSEHYPNQDLARKAVGALWRLGKPGEIVDLRLPLLYGAENQAGAPFDLHQMHGKLVVVYFWSCANEECAGDFQVIKQLTDRYQFQGLEVVFVNLDTDQAKAREYLSGRLTAGLHVYDKGGLNAPVAERYGIQTLPEAFLIAADGTLIRHSLKASQLQGEIASRLHLDR
jgi:Thioredoxin-like